MNYYICIFLAFAITVLLLNYFFSNTKEGLTTQTEQEKEQEKEEIKKEDEKKQQQAINNLNSNITLNEKQVGQFNKKDKDLNSQLDNLEKKIECATKGNSSHADAAKSKATELRGQKGKATSFPTNF